MKNVSGFTLIELLIVVAIIGILAAIAVPNFLNAQTRAKISRVEADLRNLATALQLYRLDHNDPPYDGWPDHGWARSYVLLTTPISYMPQVIADVFQAEDVNLGEGHRVGGPNSPLTYDYGTDEFHGFTGNTSHPWYRAWRNSTWKIGSCGPDLAYRNITGIPGAGWISGSYYDPSNGLISAGDIFRGEVFFQKDPKQRGL